MTPAQADEIITLLRAIYDRLAAIEAKLPGPTGGGAGSPTPFRGPEHLSPSDRVNILRQGPPKPFKLVEPRMAKNSMAWWG